MRTDWCRLVRPDSPVPIERVDQELASPRNIAAFEARFLRLLERRTAIYTMGDSTSVPKHVAVDLLRSVSFVLGIDPERPEIPERLLTVDLEDEFRRRLAEIERKVELSRELWREVVATMPPIPSIALQDTLRPSVTSRSRMTSVDGARDPGACIDYPLCHPVPETSRCRLHQRVPTAVCSSRPTSCGASIRMRVCACSSARARTTRSPS